MSHIEIRIEGIGPKLKAAYRIDRWRARFLSSFLSGELRAESCSPSLSSATAMAAAASTSSCRFLPLPPASSSFPLKSQFQFQFHLLRNGNGNGNGRAALLRASAKKKKKSGGGGGSSSKKDKNPIDPYESFGFFPEAAALLKKKAIEEDAQTLPQFADAEQEKLDQALSLEFESSLKLDRMRHYEVVFLIHEQHDDEVEEIVTKVEDFIREKKGRIWRLNDWGLRRLAYEVKKAMEAHYILMNFEIETRFINDFKTMLDKDERVIRHLVTKQDKAETEYAPPPMDYQTLLAKQGLGDDDGFWDDGDNDYTVYSDKDTDDDDDDEAYDGEEDGEVIFVDGDEDSDEIMDVQRKAGNVSR